ncbi:MAG: hypothetical protein V1886_00750 [archaeon]
MAAKGDEENKEKKEDSTADLLIGNFISLQKVLTEVSGKLSTLTEQISNLLKLFESSAKNFKERKEQQKTEVRGLTEKLNELTEQNKTIARGLSMVEEEMTSEKTKPKPLPEFRF